MALQYETNSLLFNSDLLNSTFQAIVLLVYADELEHLFFGSKELTNKFEHDLASRWLIGV